MRYFIDCEFCEWGYWDTVRLVSIGVVAEDGRTYYAQDEESHHRAVTEFVGKHVWPHLTDRDWLPRERIRKELLAFVDDDPAPEFWGWCCGYDYVLVSQLVGFDFWPEGWPFYFRDIQQEADVNGIDLNQWAVPVGRHHALDGAKEVGRLWRLLHREREG